MYVYMLVIHCNKILVVSIWLSGVVLHGRLGFSYYLLPYPISGTSWSWCQIVFGLLGESSTISYMYIKSDSCSPPIFIPALQLLSSVAKSFMKTEKSKKDSKSPCLTPALTWNQFDRVHSS